MQSDDMIRVQYMNKTMDFVLDALFAPKLPALETCAYCGGPCHTFYATGWGVSCNAAREDNEECAGFRDEGGYVTERDAIEAHNRRAK